MGTPGNESLPAIAGGRPLRPQGPPQWPRSNEEVLRALEQCYRDGSWGKYQGGNVERLETELAAYHGVAHALTCGSGTFAVETALRAVGVQAGDEVLLAAYDYPGNFLSIHAVGAQPVLVDLDADNWNLLPEALAAAASPACRAVVASHLHGGVVPMAALTAAAREIGLAVVEDAAQCPGATVEGRRAGTWGDAGVLSFGGSKLLSAGRGGAILTPRDDVRQRAAVWLNRGNHVCPLSELQAAVLLPQLARLDADNARRAAAVRHLQEGLRGVPGLRPLVNRVACEPAYYKLGFRYDSAAFGLPRVDFVRALRAEGVAFDEGFRALHVGRSRRRYRARGDLLEAGRAHEGAVILHHPVLLESEEAVGEVAAAVQRVHAWACSGVVRPRGSE